MIVIIDYGMGNIGSILNMLIKIGAKAIISSDIADINGADKLILPGVGAFDNGMRNLENLGLLPILNKKVNQEKRPILGICLGMQLFAKNSEEGNLKGLQWIAGEVKKFKFNNTQANLKIPHIGWNSITITKQSYLFNNINQNPRFYFVHSYHLICDDQHNILAETHYGYNFVSAVHKDNIVGVQFHPEKSHKFGIELLKIYKNFMNI